MVTAYFRKVRGFFARNYHQQIRVDGERAMDNLMGTMIGVLFLAVISASFAGIYMAYTVSTAKATEDTSRNNIVVKYNTDTLNNLYVESANGKANAVAAGWTVLAQKQTLTTVSPALNPSAAFGAYTFAATRPLVTGGTTLISQWGKNEAGLVTLYTAVPKAGSNTSTCNWQEAQDKLETLCTVAIDKIQSVVSPPVGVGDEMAVHWEDQIVKYPWTNTPNDSTGKPIDWASATKTNVTTSKLGVINTQPDPTKPNIQDFKYVVMFDNLQPGKKVSIDFVESKNGTVFSHTFTPTLQPGETGNVSRSNSGTLHIPDGANNITVYLDTDVDQPNNALDPTVTMYRFNIYTMK